MGTGVCVSHVTELPSGGGLDSPPVVGGVCSRVSVTGLRPSLLGSLPMGTIPRTSASLESRHTLPISGESQPTSRLLRQCLPTASRHEDLSAPPMAQLRPLHPTHSSPSAFFKGRRVSLVSHPQCPVVPSWLSEEALGVMADAIYR